MSTKLWAHTAQKAIHAIRHTTATQLVLVPGNGWTNAVTWCQTSPDTDHPPISNAEAFMTFSDPADNFAFDMHQYLGPHGAPDLQKCGSETVGKDALKEATEWLEQNKFRGFLGEFGAPANLVRKGSGHHADLHGCTSQGVDGLDFVGCRIQPNVLVVKVQLKHRT